MCNTSNISSNRGDFDETKFVLFDKNDEVLEKYNNIWKKVSKFYKRNLIMSLNTMINIQKLK